MSYLKLGIYAAVAIAIAGAVLYVKSWVEDYGQDRLEAGTIAERAKWQARESKELADANRTIVFLNDVYRKREAVFALEINGLSVKHEEDRRNAQVQHDRDVAAVRDGFRLRDQAAGTAACQDGGGSSTTEIRTAAGKPDAARGGELSEAATGFLLSEANRADAQTVKLGQVQDLVLKYWKACGSG